MTIEAGLAILAVIAGVYLLIKAINWVRPLEPEHPEPVADPHWHAALYDLRELLGRDPSIEEWVDYKYMLDELREIERNADSDS